MASSWFAGEFHWWGIRRYEAVPAKIRRAPPPVTENPKGRNDAWPCKLPLLHRGESPEMVPVEAFSSRSRKGRSKYPRYLGEHLLQPALRLSLQQSTYAGQCLKQNALRGPNRPCEPKTPPPMDMVGEAIPRPALLRSGFQRPRLDAAMSLYSQLWRAFISTSTKVRRTPGAHARHRIQSSRIQTRALSSDSGDHARYFIPRLACASRGVEGDGTATPRNLLLGEPKLAVPHDGSLH